MSTTSRILAGFLVLLAITIPLVFGPLLTRVSRQYLEAAEEPMVDTAQLLAALLEQGISADGSIDLRALRNATESAHDRKFKAQIYHLTKTGISTGIYVTDRTGKVIFDWDHHAEGQDYHFRRDVRLTLAGEYGARDSQAIPGDPTSDTMYVAAPIYHQGQIVGAVSISKPRSSLIAFIEETRALICWLGSAYLLVSVLGAALVTTLSLRPLRRLAEYARAVARGERTASPLHGAPEVVQLGQAFEEMRDALENRAYVETYVRTLTHEMKSPLAAIRGAAELLQSPMPEEHRARFLGNIEAESQRLGTQVDQLLALSGIENRKRLDKPEHIPLAELTERVCGQLRAAAESRRLNLLVEKLDTPVISGELFLIETAVSNLIQNAIDFSSAGGTITVTVSEDFGFAEIEVEDEGPGIPAYALSRVFDRFYSLQHPATGRKSSGLGLCFVREAAELHGGQTSVGNRCGATSGVRAVLRLPLSMENQRS